MEKSEIGAKTCDKTKPLVSEVVTDVYICIFFDGTGNNMYEQLNKGDHLKELTQKALEENPIEIYYSADPNLFFKIEKANYGMNNYIEQRIQAEEDYKINNKRSRNDSTNMTNNGGLKYSNVAILRSMTKRYRSNNGKNYGNNNQIGINYNLYIEGSGKQWDTGGDLVGLGMGTGRTGVVGLVSKAIVFVGDFLHSHIESGLRESVKIHFGIFGFSRGATCGRLFSYIAARGKKGKNLVREKEFAQYMPSTEKYYKKGRVCLFDAFIHTTVDFLGIYDTVSSIGFLAKDENSANKGLNQLVPHVIGDKTWYINWMHGQKFGDLFHPNVINEKGLSTGMAINEKGKSIGSSAKVSVSGQIAKEVSAVFGGVVSIARHAAGAVMNIPGATVGSFASKAYFGDAKWNFHRKNVEEYGLYSHTLENVKHTFHICAMDEFRENFALVDLGLNLGSNCTEVFMPGCHSDIGGGIMKDENIAKCTLRTAIGGKPTVMVTNPDPRIFDDTNHSLSIHYKSNEIMNNETYLEQDLKRIGWLQNNEEKNDLTGSTDIATKGIGYGAYTTMLEMANNTLTTGCPPGLDIPSAIDTIKAIRDGYNVAKSAVDTAKAITEAKISKIQEYSEGVDVYFKKKKDKIEFKRFAMEGYSNITLEMMYERALSPKVGLRSQGWPDAFLPFGGQVENKVGKCKLPERFQIAKTYKGSLGYYKARLMTNYNQTEENTRKFLFLEEPDYKELRKNFLHFSCTDELNMEQMAENGFFDKSLLSTVGANIGNPPNWLKRDKDYLLCRIIYRGDNSDDALHYMNEYSQTS